MKKLTITLLAIVAIISACNQDPDTDPVVYDDTPYTLDYGTFPPPSSPVSTMLTAQKIALGRMLFYEKKMSSNLTQACADCHRQEHAFTDTARFSVGAEGDLGGRQAMAIFNMAWHSNGFFWDGRSPELHDQATQPIQNPLEMNETIPSVIAKLTDDQTYKDQFIRAFGDETITEARMGEAMEQFMFTFISNDSKYDRSLAGTATLTPSEERGRQLFFSEYNAFFPNESGADCAHCHGGINFENDQYMNNGLDSEANFDDLGRFDETNDPTDRAKFKVTSLRNIEMTPPYMHDGRFQTLEEVVEHYNTAIEQSSTLNPALDATTATGLMLDTQEKADLVAFIKTLTDETYLNNTAFASPF
ncbi:MAG: cytochrome c peroxidase [Bacteroidia bacterium]|jgi:cytochrome c peroxidase